MPASDGFSPPQRQLIDKAIRQAEVASRFEFSVFVGAADGEPRAYAERLHAALVAPERSVLIMLDPVGRSLEIVTGQQVRRVLDDSAVGLALVEMQSQLAHGDLSGGIVRGIQHLAGAVRQPRTMHA